MKKGLIGITWAFVALLCVYLLTYYGLMVRTAPAVDDDLNEVYRSAFRFAPVTFVHAGITIGVAHETWANRFYLPVDRLWRFLAGLPPAEYEQHERQPAAGQALTPPPRSAGLAGDAGLKK